MARTVYVAVAFMMATVVVQGCCPNSDGISGYEFSHNGKWSDSIYQNTGETNIDCGGTCNANPTCVGFSFDGGAGCYVYTELGVVENGQSSEAYTKCQAVTVSGRCSGNSITTDDVDCSFGDGTTVANTQNKGSRFTGTTSAVCCEGLHYVVGAPGQNLCPSGSQLVTDENECSNTAAALGKFFYGAVCYAMGSIGCFDTGLSVCFSTVAASATHGTYAPVCTTQAASLPPLLNTIDPVCLGTAGEFVLLTKAGVTTTGTTSVGGNMGASPIAATAMTGFTLILDASNQFSTSTLVTGQVYASDYSVPTPAMMTQAISDMGTAYTDAAGRLNAVTTELGAGDIDGLTLMGGLHKWSSSVSFSSLTFDGGLNPGTVWILQIAGDLVLGSGAQVSLKNGAEASNIFWQVAGQTQIPNGAHAEGIILCATAIVFGPGSSLHGRGLAQTAVTMIATTITAP